MAGTRNCPYCDGEMHFEGDYLVCNDHCQHLNCSTCNETIHRGGIDDGVYYDEMDSDLCYSDLFTNRKVQHKP